MTKGKRLKKKKSFVLSSLSEQASRVQYKGALFIGHSDKLLLFQTQRKNQYCVNVALCPSTPPPIHPFILSFLSQFGEFCSHSHQLYLDHPSHHHHGKGLHHSAPPTNKTQHSSAVYVPHITRALQALCADHQDVMGMQST